MNCPLGNSLLLFLLLLWARRLFVKHLMSSWSSVAMPTLLQWILKGGNIDTHFTTHSMQYDNVVAAVPVVRTLSWALVLIRFGLQISHCAVVRSLPQLLPLNFDRFIFYGYQQSSQSCLQHTKCIWPTLFFVIVDESVRNSSYQECLSVPEAKVGHACSCLRCVLKQLPTQCFPPLMGRCKCSPRVLVPRTLMPRA